jgi:ubiquinone biosynthesis protein
MKKISGDPNPRLIRIRPGRARQVYRGVAIVSITVAYGAWSLLAAFFLTLRKGRATGRRSVYHNFVLLLQRLGPTFVKFGQIMSTRRDALPSALCDEMAVLHDAVIPMKQSEIHRALVAAYGGDAPFRGDQLQAVAGGSIAEVFRTNLHDGREVAVKLQRPDIELRMKADLALMDALSRMVERLPKCRGMPMGDLVAYTASVILGQLDFAREAEGLSCLRTCLSAVPGVTVPAVVRAASRQGCLVMEFIPGLDRNNVEKYTSEERKMLAMTSLLAVRQMIFVDGFVHCDLHPGNLYVTQNGRIAILDAGFSVSLPEKVRRLIAEFFTELSAGNGRRCAEIIIESAVKPRPRSQLDHFVETVAALVETATATSGPQFAMMNFGNALFDLQREFGLYAESAFVFPLIAMAVVESTVRAISPGLDFLELGRAGADRLPLQPA